MTDIATILNAIENKDIIEHCEENLLDELCDELHEALLERLARRYPRETLDALHMENATLPTDETLSLLERLPEGAVVEHVMENYDCATGIATKALEEREHIVFTVEELRSALRFGDLTALITKEMNNQGVYSW